MILDRIFYDISLHKKFLLYFFIMFYSSVFAQAININQKEQTCILKHSDVYLDLNELNLSQIRTQHLFKPYKKDYINTGMLDTHIWVRFQLSNNTDQDIHKILILTSPLLENITLYRKSHLNKPQHKGVCHIKEEHHTLVPYYHIDLPAHTSETYYLKVYSLLTPVDFTLKLDDHEHFEYNDRVQQLIDILLIGFVLALMLYSFLLYFYTKDKSYLYYSFYLFALVYQQFTYLGLTQIYFPLSFIHFDMQIPVFKVNLLVITATLFAMHFLKTKPLVKVHKIYQFFIAISLFEILLWASRLTPPLL